MCVRKQKSHCTRRNMKIIGRTSTDSLYQTVSRAILTVFLIPMRLIQFPKIKTKCLPSYWNTVIQFPVLRVSEKTRVRERTKVNIENVACERYLSQKRNEINFKKKIVRRH